MNDVAHVRFVNAHAERNRRYDCIDFFANEGFLIFFALLVFHASVIGQDIVALGL